MPLYVFLLDLAAPPCATGTLGLFAAYLPGVRPRTFCAIVVFGDLLWIPVFGDLLWIPVSAAVAEVVSARGLGEQQETSGLLSA
ncbi:hypothetical protein EMIHUDRAFT_220994 [Emiliania huxleyi CCMP1516]|uniref:Uncharacterized protein n=2 Tax=Emiliania huxleyi TaxID=2903 RepID=A0A0D3HZT3_EMIH1|nr:hypothetical protein EMIHUDRAFT_220994 [Emiliania huxleyi CCMP1516]EOD04518.1 hypothetical protein EMIHUDRAFT_220994 [Emiliania huxleyi CCMP1516]|eukprot:XP_005756947.1 hypothetical protein EMIHUDRAFT_220994 [Emiliania huxleyi CCMP1516]